MEKVFYSKSNFACMVDDTTLEFAGPKYSALITVLPDGEVLKDGVERYSEELNHIEWEKEIDVFAREKVIMNLINFGSREEKEEFLRKELLSTKEAAEILGVAKATLMRYVSEEKISPCKSSKNGYIFLNTDILDLKTKL